MFFSEIISTDTTIGFWSVYGRWMFIAIYALMIIVFLILMLKKKIKTRNGIVFVFCVICLLGLMFVSGFKTSVFNPTDVSAFFDDLDKMLVAENINISQSTDDSIVWSWCNENKKMKYSVTVRENTADYNIKNDIEDSQTLSGTVDGYKYAFPPMLPQVFNEYCRLVRYYGKLGMQSKDYYVDISYSLCGNDIIDYISVIYPFLFDKDIPLTDFLEKSENIFFIY